MNCKAFYNYVLFWIIYDNISFLYSSYFKRKLFLQLRSGSKKLLQAFHAQKYVDIYACYMLHCKNTILRVEIIEGNLQVS